MSEENPRLVNLSFVDGLKGGPVFADLRIGLKVHRVELPPKLKAEIIALMDKDT